MASPETGSSLTDQLREAGQRIPCYACGIANFRSRSGTHGEFLACPRYADGCRGAMDWPKTVEEATQTAQFLRRALAHLETEGEFCPKEQCCGAPVIAYSRKQGRFFLSCTSFTSENMQRCGWTASINEDGSPAAPKLGAKNAVGVGSILAR